MWSSIALTNTSRSGVRRPDELSGHYPEACAEARIDEERDKKAVIPKMVDMKNTER